jgi:anti-sigma factor RsiW
MHGPDGSEVLLAYASRRLDPVEAQELDRHAAECDACRTLLAEQCAVWEALERWKPGPVSPDFDQRLFDRIEREGQRGWAARLRTAAANRRVRRAAPVIAAGLAVLGLLMLGLPASLYLPR